MSVFLASVVWSASLAAQTPTPSTSGTVIRPVQDGAIVTFTYGQTQPTIVCARLRACVFQLQPGENISDKLLSGDPERWLFDITSSGTNGGTQLLSMKPTDCDLTTNLVVPTDRHIYYLTLDSPPCPGGAHATNATTDQYTRVFRFTYPEEHNAYLTTRLPLIGPASTAPERLNFEYRWSADRHVPWQPEHVFDDGAHVYIKAPVAARTMVAPVLFALEDDGTTSIINYTMAHDFYITDRVVRRVTLLLSAQGKPQRIVIENQRAR